MIKYQIVIPDTGEIIVEVISGIHANIRPLNIIAKRMNGFVRTIK